MLNRLLPNAITKLQPVSGGIGQPQEALVTSLFIDGRDRKIFKTLLIVALSMALMTISSKISFFVGPVPFSMQTMAVFVLALALGWKLATASMISWLALGALGLPVFAGPSVGPAYLLGPTGGYLAGFVVASLIVGFLAERGFSKHALTIALAMVIGNLVIYAMGVAWLGQVIGYDKNLLALGVLPFLIGDGVKILLAMIAFPLLWQFARKI